MAASAAAAAASPSLKYNPKVHLPSEQIRARVRDLFSEYSTIFAQDPSERELSSPEWCADKLLEIVDLQLKIPECCDRAIEVSHIAQFLLRNANRPEKWPTWNETLEEFNRVGHTADRKDCLKYTSVLQLEEALQLGGLVESGKSLDIVLAREQLSLLAGLHDDVLPLAALEALCSILPFNLGTKEVPERLFKVLREMMEIMERDKSTLSPQKVQRCIEVCALILDKLTLMYTQGQTLAQDYHDKYHLWNLIEYFQHLNTLGNPEIAAWGAFALERLKKVEAPISLVRVLSEAEELLKKVATTAASIHQAQAERAANKAKDAGVQVVKLVAKAKYLAPEHYWASSLEEILSKLEEAKKSPEVLKSIQEQMAKTLEKDPSHSFAYYCVQILTEVILDSIEEKVQSQAFFHNDLFSLSFIYGHITENMTGKIIDRTSLLGNALSKIRSKLPKCKNKKDIWTSPRLILATALAFQRLDGLSNLALRGDIANHKRDLEELMQKKEFSSVQVVYENCPKEGELQKEHSMLLNRALKEIARSSPPKFTGEQANVLSPAGSKRHQPTNIELQALKAFPIPLEKKVEVERSELLKQIEASFIEQSTVVVHGITGAGKTRLAESYARKHAKNRLVYWLDTGGGSNLLSELTRLALELTVVTEKDLKGPRGQENAICAVKRYFAQNSDALLVLDDLNSEEDLMYQSNSGEICLIPDGEAKVLITSQANLFEAKPVEVTELKPEEALEILKATIKKSASEELLGKLAKLLDYYPLLVDMTGRYICQMALRDHSKSQEAIINDEMSKLRELSNHFPRGHKKKIEIELEKRWETSLSRAREENENVDKALGLCAYLAPNNIPLDWFEEDISKSFGILEAYGFCHKDLGGEYISMHALVQKLSRRKDKDNEALITATQIGMVKWGYGYEKFNIPERVKHNSTHVEKIAKYLGEARIVAVDAAILYQLLGQFHKEIALFETSIKYLNRVLFVLKAIHGENDHPDVASSLNNVGGTYRALGKLKKALEKENEALEMRRRLHGENDHSAVASSLNNVGLTYYALGELGKALEMQNEALEMEKRLHGENDHPSVACSLNNVGLTYYALGELGKALEMQNEALEMEKRLHGENDHPDVARSLNNVGGTYYALGELGKALEMQNEALEMEKRLHGENDHPTVAGSLNNVGLTYKALGELRKALEMENEALEMEKRLHGENDHPTVAGSLNNVGETYRALGELGKALEMEKEALEMLKRLHGESDHPIVACSLNNVGETYRALGELGKALEMENEALEMEKRLHGENDHSAVARSLNNVGSIYEALGELGKALEMLNEALEMEKRLHGENDHPSVAIYLNNVGLTYEALRELGKALEMQNEALEMRGRLHGENDHPDVAISLSNVGRTYYALGELGKALEVLNEALEMEKRLHGENDHSAVAIYLNNVGLTYGALGELGKALEMETEALEMEKRLHGENDHPDVASSLNNVGSTYYALGELGKALEMQNEALEMLKRLHGENDHPDVARSLNSVGSTYKALGELGKALEMLTEALEMDKRLHGENDHPSVASSLNNVGGTYKALGELGKALEMETEALEMLKRLHGENDHPHITQILKNIEVVRKQIESLNKSQGKNCRMIEEDV